MPKTGVSPSRRQTVRWTDRAHSRPSDRAQRYDLVRQSWGRGTRLGGMDDNLAEDPAPLNQTPRRGSAEFDIRRMRARRSDQTALIRHLAAMLALLISQEAR